MLKLFETHFTRHISKPFTIGVRSKEEQPPRLCVKFWHSKPIDDRLSLPSILLEQSYPKKIVPSSILAVVDSSLTAWPLWLELMTMSKFVKLLTTTLNIVRCLINLVKEM